MKTFLKLFITFTLAITILVNFSQNRTVCAAYQKKTITITLKGGQMKDVDFSLSSKISSKRAGTKIYVTIAKMKGTPISHDGGLLIPIDTWGDFCDAGLFYGKKKNFKNGKTYLGESALNPSRGNDFYSYYGKGKLVITVPDGVTSITYKISFVSNSNLKNIKKITVGKTQEDSDWSLTGQ